MKRSSIVANLVVSCIILAISLVLLLIAPCFGIFCFGISLTYTIIYSIKLSDYDKQQNNNYYNQAQNNYNPATPYQQRENNFDQGEKNIMFREFPAYILVLGGIALLVLVYIFCYR